MCEHKRRYETFPGLKTCAGWRTRLETERQSLVDVSVLICNNWQYIGGSVVCEVFYFKKGLVLRVVLQIQFYFVQSLFTLAGIGVWPEAPVSC